MSYEHPLEPHRDAGRSPLAESMDLKGDFQGDDFPSQSQYGQLSIENENRQHTCSTLPERVSWLPRVRFNESRVFRSSSKHR